MHHARKFYLCYMFNHAYCLGIVVYFYVSFLGYRVRLCSAISPRSWYLFDFSTVLGLSTFICIWVNAYLQHYTKSIS